MGASQSLPVRKVVPTDAKSIRVLRANPRRVSAFLYNHGAADVFVNYGAVATIDHQPIPPQSGLKTESQEEIWAIMDTGDTGDLRISEEWSLDE